MKDLLKKSASLSRNLSLIFFQQNKEVIFHLLYTVSSSFEKKNGWKDVFVKSLRLSETLKKIDRVFAN